MGELTRWLLPLSFVFGLALIASVFSQKINKPNLIVYIIFGVLLGSVIKTPLLSQDFFQALSALGLVLLLFSIGLEMPLSRLVRSGKAVLYAGILQIFLSALVLFLAVLIIFKSLAVAAVLAFPLAMSSTAVVGKLLQEQGEDVSLSGDITLGVLIFQDLFSVLLITFFSYFTSATTASVDGGVGFILFELLKKLTAVVLVFYFVSKLINRMFAFKELGREELSLFTFAVLFFFLWIFAKLQLPETTAGFIAGVLLAQRVEEYEIFSQVRVFRDILLVIFFFALGAGILHLQPIVLFLALFLAVFLMFVKLVVGWGSFLLLGFHRKTAFWIAFDLMQLGEFSFIILSVLATGKLLSPALYQLFLLVVIWSLLLFGLIYKHKLALYQAINNKFAPILVFLERRVQILPQAKFDQLELQDHIVLCGYGRVGAYIGHGLLLSKIPLVVVDTNAATIKKLVKRGITAIYGDATETDILDYAQVDKARFLIVAVPNFAEQERIILAARKLNPKIHIFARSHLARHLRFLKSLRIPFIVQPEFEAAISILKRILKIYKFEKEDIKKRIQYLKMEHGLEN